MSMCVEEVDSSKVFFIQDNVHPQTIAVCLTKAKQRGIIVKVGPLKELQSIEKLYGALVQYPGTDGRIIDYQLISKSVHDKGGHFVCAADLLSLCLLKPPGEFGADIVVGSNQRFGVPLGYGGPHAGFLSTTENLKWRLAGRLIGVSKDVRGNPAYRLALQSREQHIRREKALSNICTAQALLANISAFYALYHGPKGLREIADKVHQKTVLLAKCLGVIADSTTSTSAATTAFKSAKAKQTSSYPQDVMFFDTIQVRVMDAESCLKAAEALGYNFRKYDETTVGISLDETTTFEDIRQILKIFHVPYSTLENLLKQSSHSLIDGSPTFKRTSPYLLHEKFNSYHTEHELLRYINVLRSRDLSLTNSMIPLGSCTMKLNATTEMVPITWPEFSSIHPFVPLSQTLGYQTIFKSLSDALAKITGFDAVTLQPNAGSQGEFTGLAMIKKYFESKGEKHRNVCLIPESAHGTNPASAALANFEIVVVDCDDNGNISVEDLMKKAEEHSKNLACLMVTYPSTHGVFEEKIDQLCSIIHQYGGQVYMDGANMNAQVGLTSPGSIGADVCHLNLHKTFAIPHGGGGPGVGPVCVRKHLAPFLPTHPIIPVGGSDSCGTISGAPWGSADILLISWMYINLMGSQGLRRATMMAILNANYMKSRLEKHYSIVYKGNKGTVAHEFLLDLRGFSNSCNVLAEDVAKRLMDYGFHAPTLSFPIPNTLMIEPTESESKAELDRFCDALIAIRQEIKDIETGKADRVNNMLKNAPHTIFDLTDEVWSRPYTKESAVFPLPYLRDKKVWPTVGRIMGAYGDRHLVCSCPPTEHYK